MHIVSSRPFNVCFCLGRIKISDASQARSRARLCYFHVTAAGKGNKIRSDVGIAPEQRQVSPDVQDHNIVPAGFQFMIGQQGGGLQTFTDAAGPWRGHSDCLLMTGSPSAISSSGQKRLTH